MKKTFIVALALCASFAAQSVEVPQSAQNQESAAATAPVSQPNPSASAKKSKRNAASRRADLPLWLTKLTFAKSTPSEVRDLFAAQLQANKPPGEALPVLDRIEHDNGGDLVRVITARQVLIGDQRYDLMATFGPDALFDATLRRLVATTSTQKADLAILRGFKPGEDLLDSPVYSDLTSRLARELVGGNLPALLHLLDLDGPGSDSASNAGSIVRTTCAAVEDTRSSAEPLDWPQLQAYVMSPQRTVATLYRVDWSSPSGRSKDATTPSAQIAAKGCGVAGDGSRTVILGSQESLAKEFSDNLLTSLAAKLVLVGLAAWSLLAWPVAWIAGLGIGYLVYSNLVLATLLAAAAGLATLLTMQIVSIPRKIREREAQEKARARHLQLQREAQAAVAANRSTAARSASGRVGAAGAVASMAAAAAFAGDFEDEDDHYGRTASVAPASHQPVFEDPGSTIDRHDPWDDFDSFSVNPANGLPMVGGMGGVDVHGNSYGTSFNDFGGGSMGGGGMFD